MSTINFDIDMGPNLERPSHLDNWLDMFPGLESVAQQIYRNGDADICPIEVDVFRAFEYFSPEDTRVVILGQDPYHSIDNAADRVRKAYGLAFGYNPEWPNGYDSSLANILVEALRTEGPVRYSECDAGLEHWAKQGVLLLNTRLTVEAGKPMSHAGKGWEPNVEAILTMLCEIPGPRVFMLWGAEARKSFPCKLKQWDDKIVLETSHPCKFSAHRGFNGCGHFQLANNWLQNCEQQPIKWI